MNLCGAISIAPNLTEMAEISLSANPQGDMLVQLVNHTGIFGVSFVRPNPIRPVTLALPLLQPPARVRTLNGGQVTRCYENGILHLTMDKLEEYEAIKLEFEMESPC